jgi:hypothetical protein
MACRQYLLFHQIHIQLSGLDPFIFSFPGLTPSHSDNVIGRAALGPPGFVGANDLFVKGFNQFLERRTMHVFGGVPAFEGAFDLAQIFRERLWFAATPAGRRFFVKKIGVGHTGIMIRTSVFEQLRPDNLTGRRPAISQGGLDLWLEQASDFFAGRQRCI